VPAPAFVVMTIMVVATFVVMTIMVVVAPAQYHRQMVYKIYHQMGASMLCIREVAE
jgi:hypothetical protein